MPLWSSNGRVRREQTSGDPAVGFKSDENLQSTLTLDFQYVSKILVGLVECHMGKMLCMPKMQKMRFPKDNLLWLEWVLKCQFFL